MPAITFDRFDGGLFLARPASTAPANTVSRCLNFDPQPGGWMRSRPSWRRTPNATLISNQFKGLESNGGNLWTFGCGNAAQVTGVTINQSQPTGTSSIYYAFRPQGTDAPSSATLEGLTKWGNGYLCTFKLQNASNLEFISYSQSTSLINPVSMVFGGGVYACAKNSRTIHTSQDGVNWLSIVRQDVQYPVTRIFYFGDYYLVQNNPAAAGPKYFIQIINSLTKNDNLQSITFETPPTGPNEIKHLHFDGGTYIVCAGSDVYRRYVFNTNTWLNETAWRSSNEGVMNGGCSIPGGSGSHIIVGDGGVIKKGSNTSNPSAFVWTAKPSGITSNLLGVIRFGSLLVAYSATSIITSADLGETWTQRQATTNIRSIAVSGSLLVACGLVGECRTSSDGITWASANANTTADLYSAAFGAGNFVMTGYNTGPSGAVSVVSTYGSYIKTLFTSSAQGAVTDTQVTDANMPNSGIMITLGGRIYALSNNGQALVFSCVGSATAWTNGGSNVGAGSIQISQHFGSGQRAYGLGIYQNKLAVFTDTSIQLWNVDPDPTAIALQNVIDGVGTRHHNSIVALQGDLLFLSDSGVRSLTTLQNQLFPTDTDVGLPVRKIMSSPEQTVRLARYGQAPACIGLAAIPFAQYWVSAPDQWDVDTSSASKNGWAAWSYSSQAKLNAWSMHSAGAGGGAKISAWAALGRTIFMRNDADDYLMQMQLDNYGVEQVGAVSAPYEAVLETQWLDFKKPGVIKALSGIDFDGVNVNAVEVYASIAGSRDGVLLDTLLVGSNQAGWTYSGEIMPVEAHGNEFKLRFIGAQGADVQINKLTLYFDELGA